MLPLRRTASTPNLCVCVARWITRWLGPDLSLGPSVIASKFSYRPPVNALRNGSLRALIFDMDGTLTDSDPLHRLAFDMALAPYGQAMPEERFRKAISGRPNAEIGRILFPAASEAEHLQFSREKEQLFRDLATALLPLNGPIRLLDWAGGEGLLLGMVTNAPRENATHMLEALGLQGRFSTVVLGEEVLRPKPDPLPYRTALEWLGIEAEEAVAFEDSVPGVQSATGAGLLTFGVLTTQPAEVLTAAGARYVIRDFEDPVLLTRLRGAVSAK
jgi:HAD superfamily hydrolase (TIGR01509 family)